MCKYYLLLAILFSISTESFCNKLSDAITLCLDNHYQEGLAAFEDISQTSYDLVEVRNARAFALSLLLTKSNKLPFGKYAREYMIGRYNALLSIGHHREKRLRIPAISEKNLTVSQYGGIWEQKNVSVPNPYTSIPYMSLKYKYWNNIYIYVSYYYWENRRVERKRFPFITEDNFGFYDEKDNIIIPAMYRFAFSFDETVGLALVRYPNGKWGYIDMMGQPRTGAEYDFGTDIWVNNHAFVISNKTLNLIDIRGVILESYKGYESVGFVGGEKLVIAVSEDDETYKKRYDVFDFEGKLVLKDCKKNDSKYGWLLEKYLRDEAEILRLQNK